jgi:hypothetical protein
MTDASVSDVGTEVPTTPAVGTPPSSSPASPAASGDDGDPFADLPADQAVFDRGWVDKLRREGQRYRGEVASAREQLATYESVYGVYPDEDRQIWFNLAQTWAEDPAKAAAVMQQIATGVLGDPNAGGGGNDGAPPVADAPPSLDQAVAQLTPEQVQEMIDQQLAQRDQSAAEQKAINDVFSEVRAAGFDPESAEGFSVLYNANHYTNGDIGKAVEMVGAYKQRIIDEYVAGRTNGNRPMTAPANGINAVPAGEPIKNIEDAAKAAKAFLSELPRRS